MSSLHKVFYVFGYFSLRKSILKKPDRKVVAKYPINKFISYPSLNTTDTSVCSGVF